MRISYEQLKILVQLTQQEADKYQTPELDELATELDELYSVTLTSDTVSLVAEQEAQPTQSPRKTVRVFTNTDALVDDPFENVAEQVNAYLSDREVAKSSKGIEITPQVVETVLDGVVTTRYTVTVVVTWEA